LPGPGYGESRHAASSRSDSFFTFPFALAPLLPERWGKRQQHVSAEAGAALRQQYRMKKGSYLGEALQILVVEASQEQEALIVDAVALREAGLRPETPIPAVPEGSTPETGAPLWESLGLIYVPCRPAALLTTRRQLETWQNGSASGQPLSASVEDALAEAVAQGHDRSGRFRAVADWLRANDQHGMRSAAPASLLDLQSALPWTTWEPLA